MMKTPYLIPSMEHQGSMKGEIRKKLDEFLDVYSFYQATRISWIRNEVKLKAYELRLLDPSFSFQI